MNDILNAGQHMGMDSGQWAMGGQWARGKGQGARSKRHGIA